MPADISAEDSIEQHIADTKRLQAPKPLKINKDWYQVSKEHKECGSAAVNKEKRLTAKFGGSREQPSSSINPFSFKNAQ